MANTIEYIFSLRDQISAKLGGITATSDKTAAALLGVRDKVRTVDAVCRDIGTTIGSLKMRVDALRAEREWIPADNLAAIKEYNREINRLTGELERLETAAGGGKFKKWASEAFDAVPGAGLLKNPLVAGVTAIGAAGMSGMNFDENMAQVNITAQLDEAGLEDLKKRLKQIAADNKTDIQVVPVGFERVNSQVDDVDLSLQILDAALKGSKAGFTDLDTVSAALAQTLSIVGKENTTAAEVLDTFFAAKRVGAGEFADFARYMPNLIAGADNLGIAYKEVAGTFAYMTGKGQSAERAATLMENAFSVLGRVDVRKKLSEAGVDIFDDTGKIRSIVDIFSDLEKVLGGMTDEQKSSVLERFGLVDKEAKSAFSVLISDIGKLEASMHDVVNATGETDAALEFSRNSVQQATEVWNQFKNIGLQVGEILLPAISAGLTVAGTVLSGVSATLDVVVGFFSGWFTLLQGGNPVVVGLTTTLGILTTAMALNYTWTRRAVVLSGVKRLADIAQAAATTGLTVAQRALNAAFLASPLGVVAASIGVVATAVTYCWQRFEGFRVAILGVWEVVKEFGRTLLDSVVKPFKQVLSGIGGVCSAIVSLLKGNFKEAATLAKEGFKDIGEGVLGANPASVITNTVRNGNYAEAWERGKQAGSDSWAASRQAEDTNPANRLTPELPEALTAPAANVPDPAALKVKVGGGGNIRIPAVNERLGGDPIVPDLNVSADYLESVQKVPQKFPKVPQKFAKVPQKFPKPWDFPDETPGVSRPALPDADDPTREYGGETGYLPDIMMNVRKIAAAMVLPLAVSLSPVSVEAASVPDIPTPSVSDAYNVENIRETSNTFTADNSRTYNDSGRSVQVGKVCDEVVIHVANTDRASVEEIRARIMEMLNELAEG